MPRFEHERHKPPTPLDVPRPLVIACPEMQSGVNLARILRVAGCCGVRRVIACGQRKVDRHIARDAADRVQVELRRSLPEPLRRLRGEGFRLVGLEQASGSRCLFDYAFARQSVLVIGHERRGIDDEVLALLDDIVEIPMYGLPHSLNVASAATMAVYEYCRQYRHG